MLVSVKFGDIDVDEAHIVVRESRLGRAGEIAVACADADDQIGLARQQIGALGAGHADSAQIERIIVLQGALARLCFTNRNATLRRQPVEFAVSVTVMDAAAGDDDRLPCWRGSIRQRVARPRYPDDCAGFAKCAFRTKRWDNRRLRLAHPAAAPA